MTDRRSTPEEDDNTCFSARYTTSGYEASFRETCSAILDSEVFGGETGEARSLRITLDVTFLSPAERASTVDIFCFYDHGEDAWGRVYGFLVSPDGHYAITRMLRDEQSWASLAQATRPATSVRIGIPTVVEADCVQSADSVVLVLALNASEFLVASDKPASDPDATFGNPTIALAAATPGFRTAVKNLRVTELRPR